MRPIRSASLKAFAAKSVAMSPRIRVSGASASVRKSAITTRGRAGIALDNESTKEASIPYEINASLRVVSYASTCQRRRLRSNRSQRIADRLSRHVVRRAGNHRPTDRRNPWIVGGRRRVIRRRRRVVGRRWGIVSRRRRVVRRRHRRSIVARRRCVVSRSSRGVVRRRRRVVGRGRWGIVRRGRSVIRRWRPTDNKPLMVRNRRSSDNRRPLGLASGLGR